MLLRHYQASQQSLRSNVQASLPCHHLKDARAEPVAESSQDHSAQAVENGRKTSRAPTDEPPSIHRVRNPAMSVPLSGCPLQLSLWPRIQPLPDPPALK